MNEVEMRMFDTWNRSTVFEVEAQGHQLWFKDVSYMNLVVDEGLSDADKTKIADAWQSKQPLDKPVFYKAPWFSHQVCSYCKHDEYEFDGFMFKATTPCPYPNGITVSCKLEVPSGRLYIGNDFRDEFPSPVGDDFNVNAAHGILDTIHGYEQGKMLHFFVGNSCPGVYHKDGEFLIGSGQYDEEGNEIISLGEQVASVCTDLWWVSIVDGDEGDQRGLARMHVDEVKVEPGSYRLEYYGLQKGFDRYPESGATIEARLFRI